jgi:hypothetical protein
MKFVSKRRMKASKPADVGQMRRRSGISRKRQMKDETLLSNNSKLPVQDRLPLHAVQRLGLMGSREKVILTDILY